MSVAQVIVSCVLVASLGLQALLPRHRLLVVLAGAAVAVLAANRLAGADTRALLTGVPWDVLVIVVALGLFSEFLAASRVFPLLAVRAASLVGGRPAPLALLFAAGMYVVSGLVNNLTALLLVLPVLLGILKLLGVSRRLLRWTIGPLLVACNLGGAATPIGDFPAILLLGRGAMGFTDYLRAALPQTAVALGIFLALVAFGARPARGVPYSPLGARLALRTMDALHRNLRVDRRLLVPGLAVLAAMLAAWTLLSPEAGIGAEAVAWLGAAAVLASAPALGSRLLRERVDVEAALFLFALFVLVGAVRATGLMELAADELLALPVSPRARLAAFLVVAAVSTALFSAGPSMAALLDVAAALARDLPPTTVYVGLAMSVCAGSSLFLTAATAGPLAQALVERTALREPGGELIRFDFADHVPVGALGFAVTLATGLAFALAGAG